VNKSPKRPAPSSAAIKARAESHWLLPPLVDTVKKADLEAMLASVPEKYSDPAAAPVTKVELRAEIRAARDRYWQDKADAKAARPAREAPRSPVESHCEISAREVNAWLRESLGGKP